MLMMSVKLSALVLFKVNSLRKKVCDVTISLNDLTKKILSPHSKYIVDVAMWPKFDKSSVSMTEVIINSILWMIWLEKPILL